MIIDLLFGWLLVFTINPPVCLFAGYMQDGRLFGKFFFDLLGVTLPTTLFIVTMAFFLTYI